MMTKSEMIPFNKYVKDVNTKKEKKLFRMLQGHITRDKKMKLSKWILDLSVIKV